MPFRFDVNVPDQVVRGWSASIMNVGSEWLETFGLHMIDRTRETFSRLAHGGTYRGVTWPAFRRKPPASRGGPGARLLDDTGTLKSSVGEIFEVARATSYGSAALRIGAGVPYAWRQQQTRPFLFFQAPDDATTAATIAARFIKKALAVEGTAGLLKNS